MTYPNKKHKEAYLFEKTTIKYYLCINNNHSNEIKIRFIRQI